MSKKISTDIDMLNNTIQHANLSSCNVVKNGNKISLDVLFDNSGNSGNSNVLKKYVGRAYSNVLSNYLKETQVFAFNEIGSSITMSLPSKDNIKTAFGTTQLTFEICIAVKDNVSGRIKLTAGSGLNFVISSEDWGSDGLDLDAMDAVRLRYVPGKYSGSDGAWVVVSRNFNY